MEKIFLITIKGLVPSSLVWESIFCDLGFVKVVHDIPSECDALVVSPSRCDAFGCPAGKDDKSSGIMYIYDQTDLPEKYRYHPRFLISNAVWKNDPPLMEAIKQRVNAFVKAISNFNQSSSLQIEKPAIKTETLGFWRDYSDEIQKQAINVLKAELVNAFRKLNKYGRNNSL